VIEEGFLTPKTPFGMTVLVLWMTELGNGEGIGEAEEAAGLGGSNAGVGGEAVEVVEAGAGGPGGKSGFALAGEMFLEAV